MTSDKVNILYITK